MAALFLAPFYLIFNGYVLHWLFCWADACCRSFRPVSLRFPAAVLYWFLALSPLTGLLITVDPWHRFLKIIGNYWLGTFAFILSVVLVLDGLRRLTGLSVFKKSFPAAAIRNTPGILFFSGVVTISLVCTFSIYGILHARKLYLREYRISIEKSCSPDHLKVALIADLHLGYNTSEEQLKTMVRKINASGPDLICITGDIFDNEYEAIQNPEKIASILASLESRYGVFACSGNHDVSERILAGFTFPSSEPLSEDPDFLRFLDLADIRLLEDEVLLIDDSFYLIGRKDPDKALKEGDSRLSFARLTENLDHSLPILVMDHQPGELEEASMAGVDLDLSGHTHGGQIFPGNLLMDFFWENPWGILKKGSMYSAVTSGVGVWGPAMRIGTDSEIMILDLSFRGGS